MDNTQLILFLITTVSTSIGCCYWFKKETDKTCDRLDKEIAIARETQKRDQVANNQRFDAFNQRFDAFNQRFDAFNQRLDNTYNLILEEIRSRKREGK